MNEFKGYLEQVSFQQAYLAAKELEKRAREKQVKEYQIQLEKIVRQQPNGFAD